MPPRVAPISLVMPALRAIATTFDRTHLLRHLDSRDIVGMRQRLRAASTFRKSRYGSCAGWYSSITDDRKLEAVVNGARQREDLISAVQAGIQRRRINKGLEYRSRRSLREQPVELALAVIAAARPSP